MFFEDNIDDAKYCGHLYGLGTSYVQNGTGYEMNVFGTQNHNSVSSHEETNSTSTNS
jgi:CCR4-NOT transcription complex subunit 7/8